MKELVEAEAAAGGYSTASEYIRQLIREAQKLKSQAKIKTLLAAGLESGDAMEMTAEDWASLRRSLRERLSGR